MSNIAEQWAAGERCTVFDLGERHGANQELDYGSASEEGQDHCDSSSNVRERTIDENHSPSANGANYSELNNRHAENIIEHEGTRGTASRNPQNQCLNCQSTDHETFTCKFPRKINRDHVQTMSADQAWDHIRDAIMHRDLHDVKEAAQIYIKAVPNVTYRDLESAFREQGMSVYLIALDKELAPTFTNMDMQGNLDKKYSITWRWTPNPNRPKELQIWPGSEEENLARLTDAGEPISRGFPKCTNCKTLGHTRRTCPEEEIERVTVSVMCFNCNEAGHRMRDCPIPREDKFACKNCKQSGHVARECPEPRSAEGVECKNCSEVGHFSRDCPTRTNGGGGGGGGRNICFNCGQEGHRKNDCTNEAVVMCRNCDATGHIAKECPLPRDYTRVKCQSCQKFGHTKVRCTEILENIFSEKHEERDDYPMDTAEVDGNFSHDFGNSNTGEITGNSSWEQTNNVAFDNSMW